MRKAEKADNNLQYLSPCPSHYHHHHHRHHLSLLSHWREEFERTRMKRRTRSCLAEMPFVFLFGSVVLLDYGHGGDVAVTAFSTTKAFPRASSQVVPPLPRSSSFPSLSRTSTISWASNPTLPNDAVDNNDSDIEATGNGDFDTITTTAATNLPNFEPLAVGVKRDIGNRLPEYVSDISDGVNAQTLATVLFLFFACLAPAVGFGSVLGVATGGQMGVIEMVASTSASGVLYALLSSQPVQLIGPQGPVVAYIAALFQLSKILQVPFLPLYAWTGLWASGFLAVMALVSASNLVQHLTRWTDEIFSVLVSVLFLFQAVTDVSRTFVATTSSSAAAVTALLTLTCAALTTGTAFGLRNLPKTQYLTAGIRKKLANFAPAIGVVVGSLAARAARLHWGGGGAAAAAAGASLAALQLPAQFVTSTGRSWLMWANGGSSSLMSTLPVATRWVAAVPAFLAAILLYLDQNITARLVNHPRFKQVKGKRMSVMDGLHVDMLALSVITALASILGLPWMCGAPTRSAAHVRALSKVDGQGQVVGTIENRVSGFSIHALIGLCALAAGPRQLLAQVPQAVLSGVFLYLGFTSLQGLELWDRVKGLLKEKDADQRFSKVPRRVVTIFTIAQMACVVAMMKVTQSKFGVLSPLLIALLPLARWGLIKSKLVPKEAMDTLDN